MCLEFFVGESSYFHISLDHILLLNLILSFLSEEL